MFIKSISLLDGILPSRYSYATGGVLNIQTKDGCEAPGGSVSMYGGQRDTIQPSFQYGGCDGKFSYYLSGLYNRSNSAFSSATPTPDAIHNHTDQGQGFGYFAPGREPDCRINLVTSACRSDNQLPNQPDLPTEFKLTGALLIPSSHINSYLDFRDYLGMLALNGSPTSDLTYQLAYSAHYISQDFINRIMLPSCACISKNLASTAFHSDRRTTLLKADLTYKLRNTRWAQASTWAEYRVEADDNSLVFKVDSNGGPDTSFHAGPGDQ